MVIFLTDPLLGWRWLFYCLLTLLITGVSLPIIYFIHRRFPSKPPAGASVLLREAMLFAGFIGLLAWLSPSGLLSPMRISLIGFCLLGIEYVIRLIERSRWNPRQETSEAEDGSDQSD